MRCPNCAMLQSDEHTFCKYCGTCLKPQQYYDSFGQQQPFSPYTQPYGPYETGIIAAQKKAQTAMVLGIVGAVLGFTWLGLIFGIIAIVQATSARRVLKNANVQAGQGQALAGLILGIIAIAEITLGLTLLYGLLGYYL